MLCSTLKLLDIQDHKLWIKTNRELIYVENKSMQCKLLMYDGILLRLE